MDKYFVACRGLKKFEGVIDDNFRSSYLGGGAVKADGNCEWPYLIEGLEVGSIYMYQAATWLSSTRESEFDADLEKLAGLFGYDCRMPGADGPGPFRELFRWGGRGTIGPVVSAKLVSDFREWDEQVRALDDQNFCHFFHAMRSMFEFAIIDGCFARDETIVGLQAE